MKYLSEYTEEATSALLKEQGAFFAFSTKQFEEAKVEGVTYVRMGGSGLIAPKENAATIMARLETIHKEGVAQDIADNGKQAIIQRELDNHEASYTGDIEPTVDALEMYGYTYEDVMAVYRGERLGRKVGRG